MSKTNYFDTVSKRIEAEYEATLKKRKMSQEVSDRTFGLEKQWELLKKYSPGYSKLRGPVPLEESQDE